MNEYLIELFKEENTVIIPGLGALTVVNRATNELMFMSYLKHNDGTLVKYIAQKEGIETESAKEKIDKYVQEVNTVIENGGTFTVSKVGAFSKDSSGEIQFSAIQEESKAEKVVTVPVITEVEQKTEEVQELPKDEVLPIIEQSVGIAEETANETITNIPEITQETVEEIKVSEEEIIPVVKENPLVAEASESLVASEEEQWNDDLDLPPLNYQPERPKKAILEKTKKDKKPRRNGTLWLVLLALVIFGGASYVGFNYNDLKEKIPFLASGKKDVQEEIVPESEEQSELIEEAEVYEEPIEEVFEEEIVAEEPITKPEVKKTEEKLKPAPVVTSSGLRVDKSLPVQAIVGSFGEEANANRLVEKLRTQGFPAEIIGVYGGLHTVSAASFNSMDDYKANRSQLEGAGAHWVKK